MTFRVDLDLFRGPLDLLLYLVRRHEVEVVEVPIAHVTDQFLRYLSLLNELDVDAAGEFLEVASILIEIKSRRVLPRGGEVEETLDLANEELVRRLLEYKQFKDVASILEERGRSWQLRCPRMATDLPARKPDPAAQPIGEVGLWDLVSAFDQMVRARDAAAPSSIVYDETPIDVLMGRIHHRLASEGRLTFTALFEDTMHRSAEVGIFLAMLELVRHHHVLAEQNALFGEIWLLPGSRFDQPFDVSSEEEADCPVPQP